MKSTLYGPDHEAFRVTAREFLNQEVVPHYLDWDEAKIVPRDIFHKLGDLGVLGIQIP